MTSRLPADLSPWFNPTSSGLRRFMGTVKFGDLLEFDRKEYRHWAIYVGTQDTLKGPGVVHLIVMNRTAACAYTSITSVKPSHSVNEQEDENRQAAVRLQTLASVWGKSKLRINNMKDHEWKPFESHIVVKRAMSRINDEVDYFDIINYNCEHFVNDCRYGRNVSFQVNTTLETFYVALSTLRQVFPLMRRFLNNSDFN